MDQLMLCNSKKVKYAEEHVRSLFNSAGDIVYQHINEIDVAHINPENETTVRVETGVRNPQFFDVKKVEDMQFIYPDFHDKFPNTSSLRKDEHAICVKAIDCMSNRGKKRESDDVSAINKYHNLRQKRFNEKQKYDDYVRNYFYASNKHLEYRIADEIKSSVISYLNDQIQIECNKPGKCCLYETIDLRKHQFSDAWIIKLDQLIGSCGEIPGSDFSTKWQKSRVIKPLDNLFEHKMKICKNDPGILDSINTIMNSFRVKGHHLVLTTDAIESIVSLEDDSFGVLHMTTKEYNYNNYSVIDNLFSHFKFTNEELNVKAYEYAIKNKFIYETNMNVISLNKGFDVEHSYIDEVEDSSVFNKVNNLMTAFDICGPIARERERVKHRILIKSSIDCFEIHENVRTFYIFSLKFEYKTEFGAEVMTMKQLLAEWCKLKFQPYKSTKIRRLHIDAATSQILWFTDLNIRNIEHSMKRLYKVSPNKLLINLLVFVERMSKHKVKELYMIHDSQKNISLYSITTNHVKSASSICDLYEKFIYPSDNTLADWIPLDDMILTHHNRVFNLLPCAFPYWPDKGATNNNISKRKGNNDNKNRKIKEKKSKTDENTSPKAGPSGLQFNKTDISGHNKNDSERLESEPTASSAIQQEDITVVPTEIHNNNQMIALQDIENTMSTEFGQRYFPGYYRENPF